MVLIILASIGFLYAEDFNFQDEIGQLPTYLNSGQYDKALKVFDFCIENYDASSNPEKYATFCHGAGTCCYEMGDLNRSGYYFLKGLEAIQNEDINIPIYRQLYCDLGQMYSSAKNYDDAAKFLYRALVLYEQNNDIRFNYAMALNNLALVCYAKEDFESAKKLIDLTVQVTESIPEYPLVNKARLLGNISTIYADMGEIDKALEYSLQSIELCKVINVDDNTLAQAINNLGIVYLKQESFSQALKSFEEAYQLADKRLYLKNTIGYNLALTQEKLNDNGLTSTINQLSEEFTEDILSKFAFLNAEQRQQLWANNQVLFLGINWIADRVKEEDIYSIIYNNALFGKGLLLRTTNWIESQIEQAIDPEIQEKYKEQKYIEYRLTKNNIPQDSLRSYGLRAFALDKELMDKSIAYSDLKNSLTYNWGNIRNTISSKEAAIEFIQIPDVKDYTFTGEMSYAALIIKRDSKKPLFVNLCNDTTLNNLLANSKGYDNPTYRLYIYGNGKKKIRKGVKLIELDCVGDSLYNLVWESISKELEGIETIYYSPIGVLNSISFEAISKDDIPLNDRYNLRLVSSTAEIPKLKREKTFLANVVIYGGIKYDTDKEIMLAESGNYSGLTRGLNLDFREGDDRSGWNYLEGSEKEAKQIAAKLDEKSIPEILMMDISANEESFKALSGNSPSLLHIATHGFYLPEGKDIDKTPYLRNVNLGSVMNRSGILFSGANRAWRGEQIEDEVEDGILTADEISKLDLSRTEMIVLSACETGLGENGLTEGVFGLQRAFKLAGVKTLVMSLWKVPDEETSQLMQSFYDNWLGGMERHEAFRKAQQQLKDEKPNPYYWAGFVMLD